MSALFAFVHHAAAFALVSALVLELVLVRDELTVKTARLLKKTDMAFGIGAPGRSPEAHAGEVRFRTLEEYRDQIRAILTPEQKPKFEEFLKNLDEQRKRSGSK